MRPCLTYANVVSSLALFLVLTGGAAYALDGSNTVFSDDIVSKEVRNGDLAADAVGTGKIIDGHVKLGDLGGGAVDSSKIVDGQVKSADVLNDNLTGADVAPNSLKGADIDESTLSSVGGGGPAGGDLTGTYPNPEIAPDVVGAAEIADGAVGGAEIGAQAVGGSEFGFVHFVQDSTSIPPAGGVGTEDVGCENGERLLSGGASFEFASGDLAASHPVGSATWFARGQNNGTVAQDLTVYAVCLMLG